MARKPIPIGAPPTAVAQPRTPEEERKWLKELYPDLDFGEDEEPKAPKQPKKPPSDLTPTEERESILSTALASLGIVLPSTLFALFLKDMRKSYADSRFRRAFKGTWQEYVESLAFPAPGLPPVAEGIPSEEEGYAPLEQVLADWLLEQEQAAAQARAQKAAKEAATKQTGDAARAERLAEAQFDDAYGALARRFPGNKALLKELAPAAKAAWQQARAGATGVPQELQLAEPGFMPQPGDTAPAAFLQGMDWDAFTEKEGLGPQWQQGMFQDAFEANVAEPMRKAATTPAQKLQVERQIAQMEAMVGPALQAQFKAAQIDAPTLDFNQFLQSDIARGIVAEGQGALREMEARQARAREDAARFAQQKVAQQASTRAAQGFAPEEIAEELGISLEDVDKYARGALQLRQYAVGQATQSFTPEPETPSFGEVRGGEFGETVYPQGPQAPAVTRPTFFQGIKLPPGVNPAEVEAINAQLENVPPEQYAQAVAAAKAKLGLKGGPGLALGTAKPGAPPLTNQQLINQLLTPGVNPQAAQQLAAMTPEQRAKLVAEGSAKKGQQEAWLNYVTGSEWGQITERQMQAASQQANTRAASEAREAIRGSWKQFYEDVTGRQRNIPPADQKRVQEILKDPEFATSLDQIIQGLGQQIGAQRGATEKAYGGQLQGYLPTGNKEFMLGAFINQIYPSFTKFKTEQREYVDSLQQAVQTATTPQGQAQALARLTQYQQKIKPPAEKNPYAGTDFIDEEVRWAAQHDQPNPYPGAPGLVQTYTDAFKGSTTSPNYAGVEKVVTARQEALKAQNAAQAEANALRLADMQRRAGGGGAAAAAATAGAVATAVGGAATPQTKPSFEQWLPAALGSTPETPEFRARLKAQYDALPEATVRQHLGLPPAAPAPAGRAFGGGPVGAGPVRVDAQGNVIEDLGTPALRGAGRTFQGGPMGAGPVRVDETGQTIEDLGTPSLGAVRGGRAFIGPPGVEGAGRGFIGPPGPVEVVGKAMKDKGFTPELSAFVAQNRQNVGSTFETADQVATRLAPQVSDMYNAYQSKKTKPPVSTFEPDFSIQPVLEKGAGREFKGGPADGDLNVIQPVPQKKMEPKPIESEETIQPVGRKRL